VSGVVGIAAAGIPVDVPRRVQECVGQGLDRACAPLAQRHDLPRRRSSSADVPDNVPESRPTASRLPGDHWRAPALYRV